MQRSKLFILSRWYSLKELAKLLVRPLIPKEIWGSLKRILPVQRYDSLVEEQFLKEWSLAKTTSAMNLDNKSGFGINLVGYLRAINGLGEAARSSMRALKVAKIPFGLVEI